MCEEGLNLVGKASTAMNAIIESIAVLRVVKEW